jgi:FAD/FMN-containing dehydrogenase
LGAFFNDAARLLGEENISRTPEHGALRGPENQDSYGDPFSVAATNEPSGAVRPKTVEEVQEIVKLANKHKIPLWTVSRGKNLGYVISLLFLSYILLIICQIWRIQCCCQRVSGA